MSIVHLPDAVFAVPEPARLREIPRSQNAVWLQHRWLQDGIPAEEIVSLCRRLRVHGIRYVYPHLSPSAPDGRLPAFSAEAAIRFRNILRRDCPDVRILPWVGGVQTGYRQMRKGTVDLGSDSYRETFVEECAKLTGRLGFDGVHLNVEPIESGDQRLLPWLDSLKKRIGTGKILSLAAAKPSFLETFNLSPLRAWDLKYLESVAQQCDQVVLMNYDTGLRSSFLYSLFVYEKMGAILERFRESSLSAKVLLGIPTYDAAPQHDPLAENMPAAIRGLRAVLGQKNSPVENFGGVALYAYWTTEEAEWQELSALWLQPTE